MYARRKRLSARLQKELLESFSVGFKAIDVARKYKNKKNRISLKTICNYYNDFREAIMLASRKAPRFEGEVEIDETLFGGRRRIKRIDDLSYGDPHFYYTRGNRKVKKRRYKKEKIMVLGILQRGGNVYTHIVKRRDADTLIPIIRMVIEPGATIYTDEWSAYSMLKLDGYHHVKINHTKKFANRKGEHVNSVERFFGFAKDQIRRYKGGFRHNFPLHLKEAEFRWNVGQENVLPELTKLLKAQGYFKSEDRAPRDTRKSRSRQTLSGSRRNRGTS